MKCQTHTLLFILLFCFSNNRLHILAIYPSLQNGDLTSILHRLALAVNLLIKTYPQWTCFLFYISSDIDPFMNWPAAYEDFFSLSSHRSHLQLHLDHVTLNLGIRKSLLKSAVGEVLTNLWVFGLWEPAGSDTVVVAARVNLEWLVFRGTILC